MESPTPELHSRPSMAACIIGDEILNGKIEDTNTRYLARTCFSYGMELKRVEVVGDEFADIADAVQRLSARYDFVVTTGGIGPTHDDITYEAIARAFGRELKYHDETLERMDRLATNKTQLATLDKEALSARRRMALLPTPCRVTYLRDDFWVPLAIIDNVHIFPGVPKIFRAMLDSWFANHLFKHAPTSPKLIPQPFVRLTIATRWPESKIAKYLTQLQEKVTTQRVKIGSYPLWQNPRAAVVITFVGTDPVLLQECADQIKQAVEGFDWVDNE
ncbi:hypothetical protein H4R34_005161 [Dimargaris verticillata]|uniref:MoaB/Mog domain-containing protein n=1 Tax=Dimargaris verticillata TaxID=2761393 RepID=A0A9W8E7E5_9FUNG|nr:hypothetical protein H4R34_005161 [Dimargaris verticillata]